MEPQKLNQFNTVTTFSKALAAALFILLPFVGLFVGYTFAPQKVVEVERIMLKEKEGQLSTEAFFQPDGSVATTTIDMGSYQVRYATNKIEVINDSRQVVQTIAWDHMVASAMSRPADSIFITNRDINYDHHLDLGVLVSIGYGGVNLFYEFYVWDPEAKQLVLEEGLNQGETGVANPTFNISDKTITGNMRGGGPMRWGHSLYQFNGNSYSLVKQGSQEAGNEASEAEFNELWQESLASYFATDIPQLRLARCGSDNIGVCFGSGRSGRPELETETYVVYSLITNRDHWNYGLLHKETGELYFLTLD